MSDPTNDHPGETVLPDLGGWISGPGLEPYETGPRVTINTSDTEWIRRHAMGEPVAHGTDIKGVMYVGTTIVVDALERARFAGADMIRFDIGPDARRDHNRYAMYPASWELTS